VAYHNPERVMLPRSVVIQHRERRRVEVSAIDPSAPMRAVGNPALDATAGTVRDKPEKVVAAL
jgi:hypothetical protein